MRHLAAHRNGQGHCIHMQCLKQKKEASSDNVVFCIAATYMSKNYNGYIEKRELLCFYKYI